MSESIKDSDIHSVTTSHSHVEMPHPIPAHVMSKIQNRSHVYNLHTQAVNCIRKGDYEGTIAELNKDRLRINNQFSTGWYGGNNHLLHVAVYFNQLKIASMLLDRGADLEPRTGFGYTPLMIGCVLGYGDIVQMLLERGANVNLTDKNNRSCIDLVHSTFRDGLAQLLRPKTPPPVIPVRELTKEEIMADERRRIKIKVRTTKVIILVTKTAFAQTSFLLTCKYLLFMAPPITLF